MRRVIVLHAPSPGHASAGWEQCWLERLPYARRLELEARDVDARRASLGATVLLFHAARHLGYGDVRTDDLRFPQGAKPRVVGGPYFSISHTAQRIACAASRECDVGFDHEDFSGAEPPAGLQRWTAVEATLKAAGAGLRHVGAVEVDPALRLSRLDDSPFHLLPLELGPGVVACLAAEALPDAIEVQLFEGIDP